MPSDDSSAQQALLEGCVDGLRAEAQTLAARVRALVELTGLSESPHEPGERRFLELEVAGSFSVGQVTAGRWLTEADRFTCALPLTLGLLETGALLAHQAAVLLHATSHCPVEIAQQVEAEVLPGGAGLCPADLRRLVDRAVLRIESEQADAAAAERRHAEAAAERRTFTRPEPDGMGLAGAVLPAEQLRAWALGLDLLEQQERVSDRQAGVERTADQRRADLFAALPAMLLDARAQLASVGLAPTSSRAKAPAVVLNVHVPVSTVLELSREPGTLDGYGPISAEHVRLLRPTSFRRVMVEAISGRPIAVDDRATTFETDPELARDQIRDLLRPDVVTDTAEPGHDPSARLARLVDVRDVRCCAPGCGSTRNHRDHLVPWPEGPTAAWNLGPLSARCHAAKHHGWTLVRHPDGSTTWTSPLARTYTRPSPHVPPPRVDLYADSPSLRRPPEVDPPWWADDTPLAQDYPQGEEIDDDDRGSGSSLPDDPPF